MIQERISKEKRQIENKKRETKQELELQYRIIVQIVDMRLIGNSMAFQIQQQIEILQKKNKIQNSKDKANNQGVKEKQRRSLGQLRSRAKGKKSHAKAMIEK